MEETVSSAKWDVEFGKGRKMRQRLAPACASAMAHVAPMPVWRRANVSCLCYDFSPSQDPSRSNTVRTWIQRYLPLEAPVISTLWPVSEKRSGDGMIGVGSRVGTAGEVIGYCI